MCRVKLANLIFNIKKYIGADNKSRLRGLGFKPYGGDTINLEKHGPKRDHRNFQTRPVLLHML